MIVLDIPGYKKIRAEHLVLDYNGTLAIDGIVISEVKNMLNILAEKIQVHVITADTFGRAAENLSDIKATLTILENENQQQQKAKFIAQLDRRRVIAIGNGINDSLMLKKAALGIAVIQKEGAAIKTIMNADIVCTNIIDALELLMIPLRATATLRD